MRDVVPVSDKAVERDVEKRGFASNIQLLSGNARFNKNRFRLLVRESCYMVVRKYSYSRNFVLASLKWNS